MMHAAIFPFGYESNTELYELLSIELPSHLNSLPAFEIPSKLTDLPNLNSFDLDEKLIHSIDSKYHSISDMNIQNKNLKTFHSFMLTFVA